MNSPLLKLNTILLSPDVALLSEDSLDECTYVCVENMGMFVKGKPKNYINTARFSCMSKLTFRVREQLVFDAIFFDELTSKGLISSHNCLLNEL